jgi:site-specific recombinase XerD
VKWLRKNCGREGRQQVRYIIIIIISSNNRLITFCSSAVSCWHAWMTYRSLFWHSTRHPAITAGGRQIRPLSARQAWQA